MHGSSLVDDSETWKLPPNEEMNSLLGVDNPPTHWSFGSTDPNHPSNSAAMDYDSSIKPLSANAFNDSRPVQDHSQGRLPLNDGWLAHHKAYLYVK